MSDTAEYGDYVSGPRIIDESVKDRMRQILGEIRDGSFAARFIADVLGRPLATKVGQAGGWDPATGAATGRA